MMLKYKISFVCEEILFSFRQRIMDMQQMIVVNQSGIVSLKVIKRNNKELIRMRNFLNLIIINFLQ